MNMQPPTPLLTSLALGFALVLTAPLASADDDDKAACVNLEEGDACTRGDGDPGFCFPDESDPQVLTCDDDGAGGDGSSGDDGCSVTPGGAPMTPWLPLALALWLLYRRR